MIRHKHSTAIGKSVRRLARLRGGGSALPGLVIEKIDPGFLARTLQTLPYGVVVISGTNGKTTTTKMVVELLRASGLRVFTNPSGSNFTRGIVASLLDTVDNNGHLDADIAVIELDEAHAVHFIHQVKPRYSLILNVLRDQLDRFGEIDHTARLLKKVVDATTHGLVLNREDGLVKALGDDVDSKKKIQYFGLSKELRSEFPNDAEMYTGGRTNTHIPHPHRDDVILESYGKNGVVFSYGTTKQASVTLKIDGVYNFLNAAAALALARMVCSASETDQSGMLNALSQVRPAFGRGEAITVDGQPLEIILVKNPSGFRLALRSYADSPATTMIAINDGYADGRDMSWLWDVSFESLAPTVAMVSGVRAYDMALRLQYDLVDIVKVEPNIHNALETFVHSSPGPKRIYCSYTAMLSIRRSLAKTYDVEAIQ